MISVIITTKNEGKYLEKCLQAIKNQTYRNFEIIVSDSCSTDNTVKIAKKYGARVIVQKSNISKGRNLGAKIARGDILAFVDADTLIHKNWLKKIVNHFKDDRVVGVMASVSCDCKNIKEKIFNLSFCVWQRLSYFFGLPINGVCSIGFSIRKDIFKKLKGFREDMDVAEDTDLEFKAKKFGKVIVEDKIKNRWSIRRFEKGGYLLWIRNWLKIYWAYFHKRPQTTHYPMYR
ncbi:MAG: glycosyltransferase [Candidatus Aenigmatarchaeota archaeon]